MKPILLLLASAALAAAETDAPAKPAAIPAKPVVPHPPSAATPQEKPAPTLVVGSSVTPDAFATGEWIQGEAPKSWEPGKVYVFECWATWCGPCIAAIPHINDLHKRYADKGLRVFGMNVWERGGKEPVVTFVKNKGEGMSYPVSYNTKEAAFTKDWLEAAGVDGIPHTFVVKDGKIVLMCHPMKLTDEVIEGLLKGGEALDLTLKQIREDNSKQDQIVAAVRSFNEAARKKDIAGMTQAIETVKALDPTSKSLVNFNMILLASKGDWPALEAAVKALPESPTRPVFAFNVARTVLPNDEAPGTLMKSLADILAPALETKSGPVELLTLSRLQWRGGDKEAAIATAKKSVAAATSDTAVRSRINPAPFQNYLAALEKGELPSDAQVTAWLREMMSAAAPAKTGDQ
ncbi:TlpA disulfide reductase family protein [Luteolibacter sp. LG18]|uniref:TlpA disulfide reductase family protein n=1 Tax=Luteolibacter sp. LG18 TaxID=2819286 RepID=UPI002B2DF1A3|nr:hypothetical protein llg_17860 [Luteolibacter sp. LG18]